MSSVKKTHNKTTMDVKSCFLDSSCVHLWRLQFLHAGSHSILLPASNSQSGLRQQGKHTHTINSLKHTWLPWPGVSPQLAAWKRRENKILCTSTHTHTQPPYPFTSVIMHVSAKLTNPACPRDKHFYTSYSFVFLN